MRDLVSLIGVAVAVFVSTNIDDILILSALYAEPHLKSRSVVVGQFLGIGTLVTVSAIAALATFVVPRGWTGLLGIFPLAMGIRALFAWWRDMDKQNAEKTKDEERRVETRLHSQILAVTVITMANGGDNLGVYIPLFASEPKAIPVFAAVFAAMTAIWCYLGHTLVNNRWFGTHIQRFGRIALPFVLIGLGLHILFSARFLVI